MNAALETLTADAYAALAGHGLFAHPAFLGPRCDPAALRFAQLRDTHGAPLCALVALRTPEALDLRVQGSFARPTFTRAPSLFEALALAEALSAWARDDGAPAVSITLPPSVYGAWVDTLRFALRARGFVSESLRLSPIVSVDALGTLNHGGGNLARNLRALTARGMQVRLAEDLPTALDFVARYYEDRERAMSETPARLLELRAAGLPVDVVEVAEGESRRFAGVFYRFDDIALYMFAGRDQTVRESLLALALHRLPALLPVRFVDLGAAGWARPDFDFAGHPVVRFKEQLRPLHQSRETLVYTVSPTPT